MALQVICDRGRKLLRMIAGQTCGVGVHDKPLPVTSIPGVEGFNTNGASEVLFPKVPLGLST
jgi:hypothetical protein